jgi:AcrR family transcriptional regulator
MVARSRTGARHRRSSIEARREALVVARALLLEHGPAGLTLNNIASKLERSHATLIHHFGCAEKLQAALMTSMVSELTRALSDTLSELEPGQESARKVVDVVFDVFDRDGAAMLAAWIMLSHKEQYLDPVRDAVRSLAERVDVQLAERQQGRPRHLPSALLLLTLCAFGDALIGNRMSLILRRERTTMRGLAADLLTAFF